LQHSIKSNKILLISHRGGSRENLENTMAAFKHAVNLGTNILEMDVCLTKDKKIVVIHDSSLQRMTGSDTYVEDYNYADLPKF
jgi:glycerophosphoryl diester phosphodiesterase